jgi:hypothetical protein
MNDKLSEVLNMEEEATEGEILPRASFSNTLGGDGKADADFKYTRDNLYNVVENGMRALESLVEVAEQSQHPRAYEVVATWMKTISDANKDLLEIRRKKQLIDKNDGVASTAKTVNNNLFLASTKDLQKLLKEIKEE